MVKSGNFNEELDSLFRYYSSQITAHSNYLVAWLLALTVSVYQLIDSLALSKGIWHALLVVIILFILVLFGCWLYGRLLCYIQLSETTQSFMGLTEEGVRYSKIFSTLLESKRTEIGVGSVLVISLYNRITYALFNAVIDSAFKDLSENYLIKPWKANLIVFSNWYQSKYKELLKKRVKRIFQQ